jgi:hypothetical protein
MNVTYKTKEERAAWQRAYRAKHPEKFRAYEQKRERPPGWSTENMRKWRERNPEKARAQAVLSTAKERERRLNDPNFAEHVKQRRAKYMADPEVRARRRQQTKKWHVKNRKENPESYRASKYKSNYGLTIEQYDTMFVAQNGCCAICKNPPNHKWHKHLHVDHDHLTDQVRQLLCHGCNTGMGGFKDDPALLRVAADYIERHRG